MKEKPGDEQRLLHIADAITHVKKFVDGYTIQDLHENILLRSACERQLQIIGEATYHITKTFKSTHIEIPWDRIEKFRHVLVHNSE